LNYKRITCKFTALQGLIIQPKKSISKFKVMKRLVLFVMISAIAFSCKKKDKEEITTTSNSKSGLFIESTIGSNTIRTEDGVDGYEKVDISSGSAFGGQLTATYGMSFQKLTSSSEPYFQINYSGFTFNDENDHDELLDCFSIGKDTLNNDDDARFSFYYTASDGKDYQVKQDEAKIEIFIDSIADKGYNSDNERVVQIFGRIPSATLYEFSWNTFSYTGNSITLTDTEFGIQFDSWEPRP
jgi:hypothetical protein